MNIENNDRMSEDFRSDMLAGIDTVNDRYIIEPDVSGQTLGTIKDVRQPIVDDVDAYTDVVDERTLSIVADRIKAYRAEGGVINTKAAALKPGAYLRAVDTDEWVELGDAEPATLTLTTDQIEKVDRSSVYSSAVTSVTSTVELADKDEFVRQFLVGYLDNTRQTKLKRSSKYLRQHNIARKRANAVKLLGIDLVAENAHEHGSRAIRRKVSHDARKGTKPAPFGGGSVKLTDADIVERHGRPALGVMSAERFQSALWALWETGRRLDLKPKTEFQRTVDALADVMGRRVSV